MGGLKGQLPALDARILEPTFLATSTWACSKGRYKYIPSRRKDPLRACLRYSARRNSFRGVARVDRQPLLDDKAGHCSGRLPSKPTGLCSSRFVRQLTSPRFPPRSRPARFRFSTCAVPTFARRIDHSETTLGTREPSLVPLSLQHRYADAADTERA